ncbi:hypothetical protein ZWY2020_009858, partial [Hordeum vulgare]
YRTQVEFHRTKERLHASARRIKLSSPVCEDGETSKNHVADLAIESMETSEGIDYMEEVCVASNKIHGLAAVALDPAASIFVRALKQAILEIHGVVVALQSTTTTTCPTLQERGNLHEHPFRAFEPTLHPDQHQKTTM